MDPVIETTEAVETTPPVATTPTGDIDTPENPETIETKPTGEKKVVLPKSIKPPVKPSGRFQGRISELVGQRDRASEEAHQLRQENARLKGPKGTTEVATVEAKNGELKPEDFASYGEYVTALANKVWEDRDAAAQSKKANESYQAYRQEKQTEFNTHAEPIAAEYEGFWEAIADPNLPITEAMADAVMELGELGPLTMLFLASHKNEAGRIARLNPRSATIAIGRIAAQLDIDIKSGTDQQGGATLPESGVEIGGAGTVTLPKPTPVPVPRGSTPAAAVSGAPSDKDDVQTWLKKETERLRKAHPQGRFYGA